MKYSVRGNRYVIFAEPAELTESGTIHVFEGGMLTSSHELANGKIHEIVFSGSSAAPEIERKLRYRGKVLDRLGPNDKPRGWFQKVTAIAGDAGRLHWTIERHEPDRIAGWVLLDDSADPRSVEFQIGGRVVAAKTTDIERADVAAAGFSCSRCAFDMSFEHDLGDARPRRLVVDGKFVIEPSEVYASPLFYGDYAFFGLPVRLSPSEKIKRLSVSGCSPRRMDAVIVPRLGSLFRDPEPEMDEPGDDRAGARDDFLGLGAVGLEVHEAVDQPPGDVARHVERGGNPHVLTIGISRFLRSIDAEVNTNERSLFVNLLKSGDPKMYRQRFRQQLLKH